MSWCGDEANLDMKDRDPHGTNQHVKVKFNDIIAEPIRNNSFDFMWDASSCCYECWFMIVYQLNVFCCGCCIAMELGIEFAQLSFCHVWCLTPCLKEMFYCLMPAKCCYSHCLRCLLDPWCEACSYMFGAFEDQDKDPDDPFRTRLF